MKKLREYRKCMKLTQDELAAQFGIKQPTLSQYESGKKRPRPDRAKKIEKITGIDRNYLVFGDNE